LLPRLGRPPRRPREHRRPLPASPRLPYAVRHIWDPATYQGGRRRDHYFEGWYFKLVDAREEHALAVIPGVALGGADSEAPHSFVQVNWGRTGASDYHRFPLSAFDYERTGFEVRIGPNRFSEHGLDLRLGYTPGEPASTVEGEVRFVGTHPWPVSLLSPGIMGWYAFVPFMECYHGVQSLNHTLEGRLRIDGEWVDFCDGRGYTEKDWGTSFPKAWVWMQTNHFDTQGTSLTASVADIPWLRGHFVGHIIGLLHEGRLHRFATYTGARLTAFDLREGEVSLEVTSPAERLEIRAYRRTEAEAVPAPGVLRSPRLGAMTGRIGESLTAAVEVRLCRRVDRRGGSARETVVFEGTGRNAGLEIVDSKGLLAAGLGLERGRTAHPAAFDTGAR
jgi:hypothetical protein